MMLALVCLASAQAELPFEATERALDRLERRGAGVDRLREKLRAARTDAALREIWRDIYATEDDLRSRNLLGVLTVGTLLVLMCALTGALRLGGDDGR